MNGEPETELNGVDEGEVVEFRLAAYLPRAVGYAAGLLALFLLTPLGNLIFSRLTAILVQILLTTAGGEEVVRHGASLQVGNIDPRHVVAHWTAAPVWLLGAGFILAYRAETAKKAAGLLLLLVNTTLVNAMVIGWSAQAAGGLTDAAGEYHPGHFEALAAALRPGYPFVMALVLVMTLLYWMGRVVPEQRRPSGKQRDVRSILPHIEPVEPAVDQADDDG